jgi:glutaredoxin
VKRLASFATAAVVLVAAYAAMQWWTSQAQVRQGRQMKALAAPGDIQMISSQTCVYCTAARRWMTEHGVAFNECFIETDASCAELYRATLARGTPTLIVRGQLQLGFSPPQVLQRLEQPGG